MKRTKTFLAILVCATAFTGAAPQGVPPPVRARIDSFVAALSAGPDKFEAMALENYTPELLAARTAADRRRLSSQVHEDFGSLSIATEESTVPGQYELIAKGERNGAVRISLTFQTSDPFKIARIGINPAGGAPDAGRGGRGGPGGPGRIGGPGSGPVLPAPPIEGSMPPEEIVRGLTAYLEKLTSAGSFAGVVLVSKNGTKLFEQGFGLADRQRKIANTPDLRFNVASIGKALTRAALGQLAGEGRIALTDTLGSRLPDYPNPAAKAATIEQLLTHAVGIVDIFDPRLEARTAGAASNSEYFRIVAPEPLLFAPGADTQYCNGCYVVLGEIIARVSGMPYERYIAERIFQPAGMTTAGFLSYGDPKVALGYEKGDDGVVHDTATDRRRGSAAGGVFMRAADLLAFDSAVREGKLLTPAMTAWFLRLTENPNGRAGGRNAIAGGTGGANAVMDAGPIWGVFVVSNLDPPSANQLAPAIVAALAK